MPEGHGHQARDDIPGAVVKIGDAVGTDDVEGARSAVGNVVDAVIVKAAGREDLLMFTVWVSGLSKARTLLNLRSACIKPKTSAD